MLCPALVYAYNMTKVTYICMLGIAAKHIITTEISSFAFTAVHSQGFFTTVDFIGSMDITYLYII